MKVLQVIPSLSPRLGGPTHVALELTRSLQDLGIDVQILTTDDDSNELLPVSLNKITTYHNLPVTFLSRTLRAKEFIYTRALSKWCRQNLNSFDLIHTHYLFSHLPSWTASAARRANIPYIMRPLGQLTPWALSQSATKKQIYASLIERRNLNQAAAVHCTSSEEAINVRDFGISTPSITLPLGVTPPQPIKDAKEKLHKTYNISSETPVLLFLSRLHHKKQPELLLKAASQLIKQKPYHVILAGTGDPQYYKQLETLSHELGISHAVSFTGFVTGHDKNLLLQGSDAFVLPSHSENFGIAVAEALASGLPVVITPGIQISTEIKAANAGLIAEPNVAAIATAINKIITNPELSAKLRENGLNLARNRYSWDAIAKELATSYEEIIATKKAS